MSRSEGVLPRYNCYRDKKTERKEVLQRVMQLSLKVRMGTIFGVINSNLGVLFRRKGFRNVVLYKNHNYFKIGNQLISKSMSNFVISIYTSDCLKLELFYLLSFLVQFS